MRFRKKILGLAGLLFLLTLVAGQEQQQSPDPLLMVLKVGSSDVSNGDHVVLQQAITEVFGRAWSYENKEFYALIKFREGRQWFVASSNKSEPGGVFSIAGIRFPQSGNFELVVTMREPDSLAVGKWLDESQWRNQSLASSNRIQITVEGSPIVEGDSGEGDFHLSVVSIANVGMRLREINAVPASGDVVLRARGLPNSKFYLAVHVPYTDRCYIVGPAKAIEIPNTYLLGSVSFAAPSDPQQVHFDVLAFASSRTVRPGPISWQSLRQTETITSPTISIIIEGRRPRVDSLRVPFVAITRIGHHVLDATKSEDRVLQVDQGDLLEVETYERTTEGAMMWALTRTKGSSLWLVQGPLLPRGLSSTVAQDGRPFVVWVLPGLQFQAEDEETEQPEFEIMAGLSNTMFPNSWISTSSISAQGIETISKPVAVRVEGYATRSKQHLSIAQVGSQEADTENELTVSAFENVVIDRPENLSEPLKIYLAKHVTGTETWSFVEAIPNGKTHFVPAVQFTNPHPREGAKYQILAIATKGPLPAREVDYHDFLPHVVMSSEILNVRYSSGFLSSLGSLWQSWFESEAEPGNPSRGISIMPLILLLLILALPLLFASLTFWFSSSDPVLAGDIADTLQRRHAAAKKKFELPESVNLPYMLLGLTLLGVIVYVIKNYYISLYTTIVATSTGLTHKQSGDLALWIILVTALAGIFADIAHKQRKTASGENAQPQGNNIHQYIFYGSISIAVFLWLFQGIMYSTFLAGTQSSGSLSLAGFGAGLLISITETIAFFIITELTLVPLGWLILIIILAPLSVGALTFRLIQRMFTRKPDEQPKPKPPPPPPADSAEPSDAVESSPPQDEV